MRELRRPQAARWAGGGRFYDLLILKCALKAGAERVYTLNLAEFTRLAPPELREKLGTVSGVNGLGRKE
jgi:hypothetical protein